MAPSRGAHHALGCQMNRDHRLTIGLPVYNGEDFLTESLESLLGQTYGDFELIISDNASTDRTADICKQYAKVDSRIRYIRQDHNIGLVRNEQFVMRQATGELFKLAAHDDLYARDLLKKCIEALDSHPEVVVAHSLGGSDRRAGFGSRGHEVLSSGGPAAGATAFSQHAIRRLGRLHLWRNANRCPATDAPVWESPHGRPFHKRGTQPIRPFLPCS